MLSCDLLSLGTANFTYINQGSFTSTTGRSFSWLLMSGLLKSKKKIHARSSFRPIVRGAVWFHKSWTSLVLALAHC